MVNNSNDPGERMPGNRWRGKVKSMGCVPLAQLGVWDYSTGYIDNRLSNRWWIKIDNLAGIIRSSRFLVAETLSASLPWTTPSAHCGRGESFRHVLCCTTFFRNTAENRRLPGRWETWGLIQSFQSFVLSVSVWRGFSISTLEIENNPPFYTVIIARGRFLTSAEMIFVCKSWLE